MIAEAFNFVQFPILPLVKSDDDNNLSLYRRNPKLCVPRDFDYSPYFEIIKYPFIDYSHYQGYHKLPWRGSFDSELSDLNIHVQQYVDNEETDDENVMCFVNVPEHREEKDA
jgi:hypothetical protein